MVSGRSISGHGSLTFGSLPPPGGRSLCPPACPLTPMLPPLPPASAPAIATAAGRVATVKRETKETSVSVTINLDGTGQCHSKSQVRGAVRFACAHHSSPTVIFLRLWKAECTALPGSASPLPAVLQLLTTRSRFSLLPSNVPTPAPLQAHDADLLLSYTTVSYFRV